MLVPSISDMTKAKRVKFTHQNDRIRPQRSGVPKTSEYAFFKRLKEDLGGNRCRPKHTGTNPDEETSIPSNRFKSSDEKLRFSPQAENDRSTYQFSLPSPPSRPESGSAWGRKDGFREMEKTVALPCAYVTPDGKNLVLSPFPSLSRKSGNEYVGKGVFAMKRDRLRQLVAKTCPDVGDGSSKGVDLVSTLLNRLFPKWYENKCCLYSHLEERLTDTNYQLPALPEEYAEEDTITVRRTSKFNYKSYCNDGDFPDFWFGSPGKRVISNWDITNSDTRMIECDAAIDLQIEEMNSDGGLHGEAVRKNFWEADSSRYLCFDAYESPRPGHLKQMNRFHGPNEPASREPHSILLGRDVNEEKDQDFGCVWATAQDVACQQTFDDSLNSITTHTPSLDAICPLDFPSLPYFLSSGFGSHDLERNDEDKYALVEASQFHSSRPRYSTLAKDCANNLMLHCKDDPCSSEGYGCSTKGHSKGLPSSEGISDCLGWELVPLRELSREEDLFTE